MRFKKPLGLPVYFNSDKTKINDLIGKDSTNEDLEVNTVFFFSIDAVYSYIDDNLAETVIISSGGIDYQTPFSVKAVLFKIEDKINDK